MATAVPLRVLTCQSNGSLRSSVDENVAHLRTSLVEVTGLSRSDKIDVVQFPETAFCRYFYRDRADLERYRGAEEAGKGAVFEFCREMALHFEAYVIAGYIEKVAADAEDIYYVALYVVGRDGSLVLNHRKRDLFQADKTWAQPEALPYSTLQMRNVSGQAFTAGLILCQEMLGPHEAMESMSRPNHVGRQFADEKVNVVFFSACWPIGNGKRKLMD
eukprot:4861213-Prymnesium_polylepis.1